MVPGTLPAVAEVEALINKSRQTHDLMTRLREELLSQQAAYFHQGQEQRPPAEPARIDSFHQTEEAKLAGGEPKKRRGVSEKTHISESY